jgi:hypothetical protein
MSGDQPDFEGNVYRVMHTITDGRSLSLVESDLILLDGRPVVVLEWDQTRERVPAATLELDPALLEEEAGRPGYFVYSGDLVDPRGAQ